MHLNYPGQTEEFVTFAAEQGPTLALGHSAGSVFLLIKSRLHCDWFSFGIQGIMGLKVIIKLPEESPNFLF